MLYYYEQGQDDPIVISETEAIASMRDWVQNKHQGFSYPNDREALADFIVINWAWQDGEYQ